MIEIPRYESDVAIVIWTGGLAIFFAHKPDVDVLADLYRLQESPAIAIDEERTGPNLAVTEREKRERCYYWLQVAPVLRVDQLARAIALGLSTDHKLKVSVVDEVPPGSAYENAQIFVPTE